MNAFRTVLLAICIGLVTPSHASELLTEEILIDQFRSGNRNEIYVLLNEIKKESNSENDFLILNDIWEGNKEKYPNLNWDIIEDDYIKVNIVDALIQAVQNDIIDVDIRPMQEYTVNLLKKNNANVVVQAIWVLAVIDDENDVDEIVRVAQTMKERKFKAAVSTLSVMCNERAAIALDELEKEVRMIEYRIYIRETREKMNNIKKTMKCK